MEIFTLNRSATIRIFWSAIALIGLIFAITGNQDDLSVFAAAVALAVVAIFPLFLWMLGYSQGLPIWPTYALVHGLQSALPMVQNPVPVQAYSKAEIVSGGMTVSGFIFLGTVVWLALSGRPVRPPARVLMIHRSHAERYLLLFLVAGIAFELNRFTGWMGPLGDFAQVFRGVSGSLTTLGLFVLAYMGGRGELAKGTWALFAMCFAVVLLMNSASLMLVGTVVPIGMVALGYTLGRGKFPWRFVAATFAVIAILHPGKGKMRELYWAQDSVQISLAQLPGFYAEWVGYGLEEMGGLSGILKTSAKEETGSSIFERGGYLHMLLLVQKKSPDEVPFLNGLTYQVIPRLLVPRFLDEEKGSSHIGNIMLSVNYGLQTIEGTQSTSIGWGLVPEAYANYGYGGVAALAVFLAALYAMVARLTVGVPLTSLRFVIGLLFLGGAIKADTMGVFASSQFQGVVGVSVAAMVLMRRQRNPFAAEGAETGGRRAEIGTRRADEATKGRGLRDQGTKGQPSGARQVAMATNNLRDKGTKRPRGEGTKGLRGEGMEGEGRAEGRLQKADGQRQEAEQETGDRRQETGGGGRRPERGERRAKGEGGKADLRPKTSAGLPKRAAPWMTPSMRKRLKAAD